MPKSEGSRSSIAIPRGATAPAGAPPSDALRGSPARLSRRRLLQGAASLAVAPRLLRASAAPVAPRPRVAVVLTEFTYRSHAHVLLENFLEPYLFNGERTEPGVEVVSLYVDQFPEGDMARDVAKAYDLPIYPTIADALVCGGQRLAVDAVMSIGEHGKYPVNEKGQMEYPRKRFFDEIAAVCRAAGRGVPVFNDKHLSYRFDWAREMYDTAAELNMPLMAGSSVPLAERRPPLELPANSGIEEAVSIHGGGVESYDFHALEVLQSMVENRKGRETGVRAVQFLEGDALWKTADEGRWSLELAQAAMAAELGPGLPPLAELAASDRIGKAPPHGILVEYADGFRGAALKLGASGIRWNFACRVAGDDAPRATSYYVGPWQNRNLFRALAHAIQVHFREGQSPYPVERTLLTTGILSAAMDSRFAGNRRLETPQLAIAYEPVDFTRVREMGATWKIITEDTPEPLGIDKRF